MLTQLNPPLPVTIIDKGKGYAVAVIDYGPEHHLIWVTALNGNGEIWCAPNPKVRLQGNWTMGRGKVEAGCRSETAVGMSLKKTYVIQSPLQNSSVSRADFHRTTLQ